MNHWHFWKLVRKVCALGCFTMGLALPAIAAGKIAFVSNRDGNNEIYSMNTDGTSQLRLTANSAEDAGPSWSADGSKIAFHSNRDGNFEIYVMRANGSNPERLTSTPAPEYEPSFSADGSKITFVSARDGNSEIYVMNADGSDQTRLTTTAGGEDGPCFNADGSQIFFHSNRDGNDEVYVMNADGTGQTNLTNDPGSDKYPAFSGGKVIFQSNRSGSNEIYAMNADGTGVSQIISSSTSDELPAYSPDGTQIVFTSSRDGNNEIYLAQADGSTPTRLTNNAATDSSPSWSTSFTIVPSGKLAFISNRDGNGEIYVMNADGTAQTNLSNSSQDEGFPAWRFDGNKITYQRGEDVWAMNGDGSGQIQLTTDGHQKTQPYWSPDGSQIAFSAFGGFDHDIFVIPATGSTGGYPRAINNPLGDYEPCWSHDGTRFVFTTFPTSAGISEVYVAGIDGSNQVQLTNAGANSNPDWSPDDSRIVFSSQRDGSQNQIYIMNADGSNQTRLTSDSSDDSQAVWSPDGTQIAFKSNRDGNDEIYVMNADGSGQTRVTNNSSSDSYPIWISPLPADSPSVSVSDAVASEADGNSAVATFTVSLSAASTRTVTVKYRTLDGTAVAPGDYTAIPPSTLTFAPGETSKTVSVVVQDDIVQENTESFSLRLFSPENASLGDLTGAATITDNDIPPTLSIGDASITEGNSGTRNLSFPLVLSSPSGLPISVTLTTVNGTALAAEDFTATSATFVIPAGQSVGSATVPIRGDTTQEPNETFLVNLSNPVNATLNDAQAVGTIINDDYPVLSVADSKVFEGNSGTTVLRFTATLSYASAEPASFDFTTSDGTAIAGLDYISSSGSRTIPAGQTSIAIDVLVNGDTVDEPHKSFTLKLSNLVGATGKTSLRRNSVNGHFYELVSASFNWNDAKTNAIARTYLGASGYLATSTSEEEQSFIFSNFGGSTFWLGGTQANGSVEPAGGFSWVTGEPFIYSSWNSGEPNNTNGNENTVQQSSGKGWNDVSGTSLAPGYLVEYDVPAGTPGSGGVATGTIIDDDGNVPPTNVSFSPSVIGSSSGIARTFTAVYSDEDTVDTFKEADLLVQTSIKGPNSLLVSYDAIGNKLYLYDDNGSTRLGGFTPGSANIISNSQGSLNCALTTVNRNGNNLTINWNLTPTNSFGGVKNVYLYCLDNQGASAGWEDKGDWTINAPPVNVSITPNVLTSNVGLAKSFTALYSDINGASDIRDAYILVNTSTSLANGLYADYNSSTNRLYLSNDAGVLMGGFAPGSANIITNSQGSLNCAATSVSRSGNNLTVNWNLTPANIYLGQKNLYLSCRDLSNTSPLEDKGDWNIVSTPVAPVNLSVAPSTLLSNGGVAKSLAAVYSDGNGANDIKDAYLLVRNNVSGPNSLFCYYDVAANKLYLCADNGTTLLGGFAPGSANVITNSQGSLNCAAVTVNKIDNNLTVNWNLTPNSSYVGTKNVYLYTRDQTNSAAGWDDLGDWTINAPPVNTSVTPSTTNSAFGVAKTFAALYSDANGATDIKDAYILVQTNITGSNALFAHYDSINNKLYLIANDGVTPMGGFAPGSANVISNSQGSLNCAITTVTRSGNSLTVNWNLTPTATFLGAKNLYLYCDDNNGAIDNWKDNGDWNITTGNASPVNVSVTPDSLSSSVGIAKSLTALYSDANGAADIKAAYILVQTNIAGPNALFAHYDSINNKLYLIANDGVTLIGGFAPGSPNVISNGQGSLNCASTTVTRNDNNLTVNWNFTPAASFLGAKNVYLYSQDTANAVANWVDKGDWNITSSSQPQVQSQKVPSGTSGASA